MPEVDSSIEEQVELSRRDLAARKAADLEGYAATVERMKQLAAKFGVPVDPER